MNRRAFLQGLAAIVAAPLLPNIPVLENKPLRGLTRPVILIDEMSWFCLEGLASPSGAAGQVLVKGNSGEFSWKTIELPIDVVIADVNAVQKIAHT